MCSIWSKPPRRVADFCVELNPEGGVCTRALKLPVGKLERFRTGQFSGGVKADRKPRQTKRQEGSGIGDGIRLHERSKALKGEPHERIWHEIRPVSEGRNKAPRGWENLKAQAVGRGNPDHQAAVPRGKTL